MGIVPAPVTSAYPLSDMVLRQVANVSRCDLVFLSFTTATMRTARYQLFATLTHARSGALFLLHWPQEHSAKFLHHLAPTLASSSIV